jgi:hypothetical protein
MPQEQWGGEVHMPRWMRWVLHRPPVPDDTPERAHEARKPQDGPSVMENANRAVIGAVGDIYAEGRSAKKASPRGDKR